VKIWENSRWMRASRWTAIFKSVVALLRGFDFQARV
jgi:hypothetical protein